MDKIIRCITSNGAVMVSAIDSTDIVYAAKKLHNTSASATAAFGRLLTGASLMGAQLKQKDASLSLRVMGGGEIGTVFAAADSRGYVRGYVGNAQCRTEHYENGKINVAAAVGGDGTLTVTRDYGTGEPYTGQVELVSGEIAEDIASYFANSEQIPTVCVLGVLLEKESGEVLVAGGLLAQLLPGAFEEDIDLLEKNAYALEPVTTMLAKGMTPLDMCHKLLEGFEVEVLDEMPVKYSCPCSKEGLEKVIAGFSADEIRELYADLGYAEAKCYYCNRKYVFTKDELETLIKSKENEA